MISHARDRAPHRLFDVVEGTERIRRRRADFGVQPFLELAVVNLQQPAVGVVDEDHLARLQRALREHQRAQHVVGDDPAGVANDVRVADRQAEQPEDVDARIHAGDDREMLVRHRGVRSAEARGVQPGIVEQAVDDGNRWSHADSLADPAPIP